jgi:hypothetical protein
MFQDYFIMKKIFSWPLLLYLRFFARRALKHHRPTIIGVAGAVGRNNSANRNINTGQGYHPPRIPTLHRFEAK